MNDQLPNASANPVDFLIVRNDLPIRWQRRIGLAPENDLGVSRRALFFAMFTWLPIVIWATLDTVYHQIVLDTLKLPLLSFVVLWGFTVLAPLFVFSAKMISTCKRAMREYSALLAEHGRLVHQKWILGQKIGEQFLSHYP